MATQTCPTCSGSGKTIFIQYDDDDRNCQYPRETEIPCPYCSGRTVIEVPDEDE